MANYTFYVTVSGGKFVIDGVSQQTVDLGHNLTYRFDQSDSSNGAGGTHPLRFSTTSDGTHGGGSALGSGDGVTTNGTPGSSGAYTEIAVTSSTTNPLYYYCSNHSGMGGQANTTSAEFANTTGVALKKPILANATDKWGQFSNQNLDTIAGKLPQSFVFPTGTGNNNQVILSDGSGGTSWGDVALTPEIQGVTWYSDSGYSSTLSASEAINIDDATYLKVTGQNFGSSGVFGNNAYVQIINTTQSNAVVGHNQNSLNGCVTSASYQSEAEVRFTINPNGVSSISSGDTLKVKFITGGGESLFATGYVVSADPTSVTTVNSATISNTASVGSFGGTVAGGGEDSNTKLLLNFDRTGGTDIEDSSNIGGDGQKVTASGNAVIKASPFGDGKSAMFFDGTNDYINVPASADWDFSSTDVTFEFWMKTDDVTNVNVIMSSYHDTNNNIALYTYQSKLVFEDKRSNSHSGRQYQSGADLKTNTWHHIAIVYDTSATTMAMYIDGKYSYTSGSSFSSLIDASSRALQFGGQSNASNYQYSGYLDEIRIVKGTAVYTSNFSVPTSRLTAITNTKLLIHSNQSDDESSNQFPITATNAYQTVTNGRTDWGGSNWYSDGSGDYLTLDTITPLGTGNWTVDFWVYPETQVASDTDCIVFDTRTSSQNGWFLSYHKNDKTWRLYNHDGSSFDNHVFGTVTSNVGGWDYIALEKYNNVVRLWVNDTQASNTLSTSREFKGSTLKIFTNDTSSNAHNFKGHLEDIRFSDTARYTSSSSQAGDSITKPTTTFTADNNTTLLIKGNGAKFTDSSDGASDQTTAHNITPTGSFHSQGHKGIAPALTFPASLKKTGSAGVYFDGNGDVLNLNISDGDDFDTAFATGVWSLDTWCYMSSYPADGKGMDILSGTDNTAHGYDIGYHNNTQGSTGYWGFIGGTPFTQSTNCTDLPSLNTWFHILMVCNWSGDNLSLKIYKNGEYLGEQTSSGSNRALSNFTDQIYACIGGNAYHSIGGGAGGSGDKSNWHGYLDNWRFSGNNVTADSSDPLYTNGQTSNSSINFVSGLPTKIYGAFKPDTIDTITLTGSVGSGQSGYVTFNNATLSGNTETTSALPAGLTLNEAESQDNTATITGDLTVDAGSHAINLVARVTSDGTDAEIDPNRKQAYSHTITKASGGAPTLFNARRYVGNESARDINGFGFQPDLVWCKNRDQSDAHNMTDSVRGVTKVIYPNSSYYEDTETQFLTSFNADGYSVGNSHGVNGPNEGIVAWGFKAGGAPSGILAGLNETASLTNGVGNGTLNDGATGCSAVTNITQSVNQNSGFSITKYEGTGSGTATFPHNLGGNPDWIIIKRLTGSDQRPWVVWHSGQTNATSTGTAVPNLYLDQNVASQTNNNGSSGWGTIQPPSSTLITVNAGSSNNSSVASDDVTYICYAWKAVSGVSAFGTYSGASAPTTVYTTSDGTSTGSGGFSPRFVIVKRTDGSGDWWMYDKFRGVTGSDANQHTETKSIKANLSDAEASPNGWHIQFLTNGFKFPDYNRIGVNNNGESYIYMALA